VSEPAAKKTPGAAAQATSAKPAPVASAKPAEDPADWVTHMTEAGEPYFHNKRTGQTTWDKPAALLAEGESNELEGEWAWVMHDEMAWIPAKVVSRYADGSLEISEEGEGCSGERRKVKAKEVGPAIPSAKYLTNLTSDLVQLDEVSEPTIIDLLRRRYKRDKIYTSVGDILVVGCLFATPPLTQQRSWLHARVRPSTPSSPPRCSRRRSCSSTPVARRTPWLCPRTRTR
jgi:hypothetical protein